MVNWKHSVKLKSALKIGTPGTNEDQKNPLKKLWKKIYLKETIKESHFSISLEILPENLKFTRVPSKK